MLQWWLLLHWLLLHWLLLFWLLILLLLRLILLLWLMLLLLKRSRWRYGLWQIRRGGNRRWMAFPMLSRFGGRGSGNDDGGGNRKCFGHDAGSGQR